MTSTEKIFRKAPVKGDSVDQTFSNPTTTRTYNAQFNKIYSHRSSELKSRVMKMAHPKWSDVEVNGMKPKYVPKVLDVPFSKPVFIIGTTLADMKYKPDVLKEVELSVQGHFTELKELVNASGDSSKNIDDLRKASYSDPDTDKIWLEDESGRILITGDILKRKVIVTGLVIAVLGMEIESGVFHVVDIVYPEPAAQKPIQEGLGDGKLLLSSGLNVSDKSKLDSMEILKSWIFGELGDERVKDISELMVVGNSLDVSSNNVKQKSEKKKYVEDFNSNYSEQPVRYLDSYFAELLQSIPVSVVPGPRDIVELGLPKQPLHHSLFPLASQMDNFKRLTEPAFYDINGLRILVSSGEAINDIMKYIIPNIHVTEDIVDESIMKDSRLRLIEDTLLWQIIAPTAPDTLWCYPFEETDPFTLKETPHVYIVGNQPRFETSIVELQRKNGDLVSVRIIALPEFSETNSCVLFDFQTLNCELVSFQC